MKINKVFTIGSLITFFALLPALIFIEVRVLNQIPNNSGLLTSFIIIDILLVIFAIVEIFIVIRNWRKEKASPEGTEDEEAPRETVIDEEWGEETSSQEEEKKVKEESS